MDEAMENNQEETELTERENLTKVLEDGASVHIKDLNALILEQKNAKTRTKKGYVQKKIDKKKDIVLEYMEQLAKLRGNQ